MIIFYSASVYYWSNSGINSIALYVVINTTWFFQISACFVYIIIGSAMATTLNRLESDFRFTIDQNVFVSDLILMENIMKIQHCYQRVCLVVKHLLRYFEWIFLLQTTNVLLCVINAIPFIIQGTYDFSFYVIAFWMIELLLRLWLIAFFSDCLNESVRLNLHGYQI